MFFAGVNASILLSVTFVLASSGSFPVHSLFDMHLLSLILHHSAIFCSAAKFVMV